MRIMQTSLSSFEQVADGVFVAVAEPASVNIGLVVGRDSALVIDTGCSPPTAPRSGRRPNSRPGCRCGR